MSDVILTEAEFEAVKSLIDEARATKAYFGWLAQSARRITREDIAQPKLSAALEGVKDIDLDGQRVEGNINADVHSGRVSRSKK